MDIPRKDYFGNYNHGGPNFPQNDPGYPQQQQYNNNNNNYQEPRPLPPPPPQPPPHFNGPEPNFNYNQRQEQQPMNNAPNGSFPGGGGSWPGRNHGGPGNSGNFPNRKRGWSSNRHGPPDHGDGMVKLYVASVPRTATENEIWVVFEQHGRVAEVILLKDKRTGQQQGSCFVKYGTREEADQAIRALSDKYTFHGEVLPLKVKYADGSRERLGSQWATGSSAAKGDNPGSQWEAVAPPSVVKGDNHGSQWAAPAPPADGDNQGSQWAPPPPPPPPANGDNHGSQWAPPAPPANGDNHWGQFATPPPAVKGNNHGDQWTAHASSINGDNHGSPWTAPPSGFKGGSHGGQWAGPPSVVNGDTHGGHRAAPPSIVNGASYGAYSDKLYIGGVSKQATRKDIEDLFSPYGVMEDVFVARDHQKQNRCAFVKYSHKDMALAAINSLNGTYIMRGCDLPLIVRFATPKKPKTGDPRLAVNHGDPTGGFRPNSSHTMHHKSATSQQPVNQVVIDPRSMSQPFPPVHQTPPQFFQGPPPQVETAEGSQLSKPLAVEGWKQSNMLPKSNLNLMQQPSSKSPRSGFDPQTAASTSTASTTTVSTEHEAFPECDWSQHICPDGHKYFYNCVTFESSWKKPEEYAIHEQELEKQQKQRNTGQNLNSASPISVKQVGQPQQMKLQDSLFHQEKVQAEVSPAVVPAFG